MRNICFSYGHNKSCPTQHPPGSSRGGNTLHPLAWDTNRKESRGSVAERLLVTMTRAVVCRVLPRTHILQHSVLPVPSSPMVSHSADVAKQSLCHGACRKPSTTVPMMNPVSLPSFISTAMCPQGGCASRHLCTSSSLVVQGIILDFNPHQLFELLHSLLKLVSQAKIH